ncbi:hypothetical protein [Pseudomonas sp.]|uniref:hypothetical protein n=1 Tax=Pseudomonas sp. TaxID=306 RepID=UPI0028A031FE|nr:hypothetical protein [Pseudomonas sp.]
MSSMLLYWFSNEDQAIDTFHKVRNNKPDYLLEAEKNASYAKYSPLRKRELRQAKDKWENECYAIVLSIGFQFQRFASSNESTRIMRRMYGRLLTRRCVSVNERTPSWFGEFDRFVLEELESLKAARREATGLSWHIDHMIPLEARTVSGLHCASNLQLIPGYLNTKKGRQVILTEPFDWLNVA